jgi:hypothetical protein
MNIFVYIGRLKFNRKTKTSYICIFTYPYKCAYIFTCMNMCIYICIYIYIYIYIYVNMYIYLGRLKFNIKTKTSNICIFTYVHIYSYKCAYIFKCTHTYIYVYIYIYIYKYTYKYTYMNIYIFRSPEIQQKDEDFRVCCYDSSNSATFR